jgi:signal transduction histidine kinase
MTKGSSAFVSRVMFLVLIILTPIAIINFPKYLTHVAEYDQKVMFYTDLEDESKSVPLPSTRFEKTPLSALPVKGFFTVSVNSEEVKYLYFPFHVGRLKLWLDDSLIFDSNVKNLPRPVTQISNALVEIPAFSRMSPPNQSGEVKISFELIPSHRGLTSLSNIYVGSIDNFNQLILKNMLYYDAYRTGLLGAQIVLLILLTSSFFLRGVGTESVPPILILVFVVMLGFGSLSDRVPYLFPLSKFAISTSPVVIIALLMYFNFIKSGTTHNRNKFRYFLPIGILLVPPIFMLWGVFDYLIYNVFFALPVLILGLFILSVWSILSYIKLLRFEIGFWALSLAAMLAAVLRDFLFSVGVLSVAGVTTTLSSSVLIIILSATFTQIILRSKKTMADANETLTMALADQSNTLNSEFENSARLLKQTLISGENNRLTRELHDGVLTYMGIINALSEKASEPKLQKINQLARYAVNEIRVILDARPADEHSLTIALGSLREQMVDPLHSIGVNVEWSNLALLDYGKIDPKVLMNIIRIIQEAIHNAAVRAGCAHLSVVAYRIDDKYKIIITNAGGQPFCEEHRRGHGIANMMSRAASFGCELTINPTNCGAVVTLNLPRSVRLLSSANSQADTDQRGGTKADEILAKVDGADAAI